MLRTGDILGYARVSTTDQDLSSQKDRLKRHGAVRVFEDVISGRTFNRPGLAALLDHARPNDTLAWDGRSKNCSKQSMTSMHEIST